MNYTLNQLEIYLRVVECKSITKAAEELHLTQPAVSIQLKNFQAQFDIALTEIVGRRLFVTAFGEEVAEIARTIMEQANLLKSKSMAFKGQLTGKLHLSIVSTAKYVMPYFLTDFLQQNPGVELQMDVTNKVQVIKSIENNEVDFSLVSILPDQIQLEAIDLLQNKLYLVANSELEGVDENDPSILFNTKRVLFREEGSGTRQTMERYIMEQNISVQNSIQLTSNEAVKQALLAGMGVSVMPLIGIKNELYEHQLKIIPIAGLPIITKWQLIWQKGKKHGPVAQAFIQYIHNQKEQIVKKHFNWYESY